MLGEKEDSRLMYDLLTASLDFSSKRSLDCSFKFLAFLLPGILNSCGWKIFCVVLSMASLTAFSEAVSDTGEDASFFF